MTGDRIRLVVKERERTGSRESRRLRRQGLIPGVLYGRGRKPYAILIEERELRRVLTGEHGTHAILDIVLEGQKTTHPSVLKDYQRDPIRGRMTHFDLQEVRLDQPIRAAVVVEPVGEAAGVKMGGVLQQVTREVTVEALPLEMPDRLPLDVTALELGGTLRVADLQTPAGVTVVDDPEAVLVSVAMPRRAVEIEEVVEEEVAAEAEEAAAEAEEAAAEAGAEAAEPSEG